MRILRAIVRGCVDDLWTRNLGQRFPAFLCPRCLGQTGPLANRLAKRIELGDEVGWELYRGIVSAGQYGLLNFLADLCGVLGPLRRFGRHEMQVELSDFAVRICEQMGRKLRILEQMWWIGHVVWANHRHVHRSPTTELHHLREADSHERVEQDGQHEDHEQRAAIAQLVADLSAKNQPDVGEIHRGIRLTEVRFVGALGSVSRGSIRTGPAVLKA